MYHLLRDLWSRVSTTFQPPISLLSTGWTKWRRRHSSPLFTSWPSHSSLLLLYSPCSSVPRWYTARPSSSGVSLRQSAIPPHCHSSLNNPALISPSRPHSSPPQAHYPPSQPSPHPASHTTPPTAANAQLTSSRPTWRTTIAATSGLYACAAPRTSL